ncbi:MAG: peptidoglycan-binding domain-containing protein [Planctomycetota bacterium]|jgi:murein L,D-transpeptidase YcbB/YkuD
MSMPSSRNTLFMLLLLGLTLSLTNGCKQNLALPSRVRATEQSIQTLRQETTALRNDLQALREEQQALQAAASTPAPAPVEEAAPLGSPLIPLSAAPAPTPITPERGVKAAPRSRFSRSQGNSLQKKHIRVAVSVRTIQRCLQKARCNPGAADGVLGKQTIAAIKTFQRRKGLTADGVVGKQTWTRLRRYR